MKFIIQIICLGMDRESCFVFYYRADQADL